MGIVFFFNFLLESKQTLEDKIKIYITHLRFSKGKQFTTAVACNEIISGPSNATATGY